MVMYRSGPTPAGTCPRCRETLLPIQGVDGTRWCEKCGGVFADLAASKRIVSSLDRVLLEIGFQASLGKGPKRDDTRKITCPECLIEMIRTRIESTNCDIDACPAHGTWFDTGELVDVLRALNAARRRGIVSLRSRAPTSTQAVPELDPEPLPSLRDWLRQLRS